MANPDRYDYDSDKYYYDEDTDTVRSYEGDEVYSGDGERDTSYTD